MHYSIFMGQVKISHEPQLLPLPTYSVMAITVANLCILLSDIINLFTNDVTSPEDEHKKKGYKGWRC